MVYIRNALYGFLLIYMLVILETSVQSSIDLDIYDLLMNHNVLVTP